jgi:hypothetical protein
MLSLLILLLSATSGNETTDPELLNVIASRVRQHGYQCDAPNSMVHEDKQEGQGEHRWVISCENGNSRYRVRLYTNNTSKVEKLD